VEIHPGVFVSSTDTQDWRPDPEGGGELHVLVEQETAYVGMSRFGDVARPEPWTLPERETLLVLEGVARIDIKHGPTSTLRAGDLASLPRTP
jgi:quercetin dioxygenase-like cupin family protein